MQGLFKQWTTYLAQGSEACAAILIGLAVLQATLRAIGVFLGRRSADAKEALRLHLGQWLALGLEFELAADVLRTTITPTWNEIGQLAAIIVLRTVLNFFLQREIDKAAATGSLAAA